VKVEAAAAKGAATGSARLGMEVAKRTSAIGTRLRAQASAGVTVTVMDHEDAAIQRGAHSALFLCLHMLRRTKAGRSQALDDGKGNRGENRAKGPLFLGTGKAEPAHLKVRISPEWPKKVRCRFSMGK
jgi:hypothetical protein